MTSSAAPTPTCVVVGSIFIDDIVFPNGETRMEILGGGGVHAAAGMSVWQERAGLVACIGSGIPQSALARLRREFDLRGVLNLDIPQMRAWQLFEWDGRRIEVPRVEQIAPFFDDPQPDSLPDDYQAAQAVYVLRDAANFRRWRAVYDRAIMLWEPSQAFMKPENRAEFLEALPLADIVSPNLLEANQIYGLSDPYALVDKLLADGARAVALRLGEYGSLVAAPDMPPVAIPVVPVLRVVDQTGAGNTFCGGFLVGWLRTGSLIDAACYGTVAASFALETIGVLSPMTGERLDQRDERYQWVLAQIT